MTLQHFIAQRQRYEEELPELRKMAENGLVGKGAVARHMEVIDACRIVEKDILQHLGVPA